MADKNQTGLMQKIYQLCIKYNSSSMTLNENNETLFTSHIKQNIRKALTAHQLKLIATNRKLNFYASFRKDTRKAGCLDVIKNPHRIAINKFRLGNHKLRIETGRHTIPKTPLNLRICSFFHSNEVENQIIHFLFSCQLYDSLRLNFFNDITDKYGLFNELDINAKVLFLFNSIDPFVCRSTAAFVFQAMSLRHEISSVK